MMHAKGQSLETTNVSILCDRQKIWLQKKKKLRVEARLNAANKTELGNGKDRVWCQF